MRHSAEWCERMIVETDRSPDHPTRHYVIATIARRILFARLEEFDQNVVNFFSSQAFLS